MTNTLTGCTAVAAGAITMIAASTQAGVINPGTYLMHNHPDGSALPPAYGLRLDGLTTGDTSDEFTFDFDAPGAQMLLSYDGTSINISGTAFGGLDTGSGYDPNNSGMVEIDFTYDVATQEAGDDDLVVTGPDNANTGSIEFISGNLSGQSYDLSDYSGSNDFKFRLGNEDDDNGHRDFSGISGWGWLNHSGAQGHLAASDWLFTIESTPVPGPAALAMLGVGIAATGGRRRK